VCIGRVGEDLREDVGVVVGVVECFTPGAMRCGGQKPEFHGSSFVVASSGHFREDVANMSLKKIWRVGRVGRGCYEETGTAPVEFLLNQAGIAFMPDTVPCGVARCRTTPHGVRCERTLTAESGNRVFSGSRINTSTVLVELSIEY